MYYIGNVRYFLKKEKFGDSAITEIIEKLGKETINKTSADEGLFPAGSIRDVLPKQTASEFVADFNEDPTHLEITIANGKIPEVKA